MAKINKNVLKELTKLFNGKYAVNRSTQKVIDSIGPGFNPSTKSSAILSQAKQAHGGMWGYDRDTMAKLAAQEFSPEMLRVKRPFLERQLQNDQNLQRALDQVLGGTSDVRFATGYRTMTEPTPHSVLTGTYKLITDPNPDPIRLTFGTGYVGTKPIKVTPKTGLYYSKDAKFGGYASIGDSIEAGLKYGYHDFPKLREYILESQLNPEAQEYVMDIINRMESFERGFQKVGAVPPGPETTSGWPWGTINRLNQHGQLTPNQRIKAFSGNVEDYEAATRQYVEDYQELAKFLAGDLNYGARGQEMIFRAPSVKQIIMPDRVLEYKSVHDTPEPVQLIDYLGMRVPYITGKTVSPTWKDITVGLESGIGKYNTDFKESGNILDLLRKNNVMVEPPYYFRMVGDNPIEGMVTMQIGSGTPVFKNGKRIIYKNNKHYGK